MRPGVGQRGFTLVECMIALAVTLVGAVAMMGLFTVGVRMNGDARRVTRATAIAQDLLNNIELWSYTDARLSKVSSNTTDIADAEFQFEKVDLPLDGGLADHGEASLGAWNGIPASGLGAEYERYWNVLHDTNGSAENDIQIAVVVRWKQGSGWRRIVLQGMKLNPSRT